MDENVLAIGPLRLIRGGNKGRYPFCHSLYIPGAGLLIDPGSNRKSLEKHLNRLVQAGVVGFENHRYHIRKNP
jgi:hypothetical protein